MPWILTLTIGGAGFLLALTGIALAARDLARTWS